VTLSVLSRFTNSGVPWRRPGDNLETLPNGILIEV